MPMRDWFEPLIKVLSRDSTAVLVTVIAVDGSVPREPGAALVVSVDGIYGTIGGGNLEHSSIKRARSMLASDVNRISAEGEQECHQLSLGPSLGQCCGGRVELLFERVSSDTSWISELTMGHEASEYSESKPEKWLCRNLDNKTAIIATPELFHSQVPVSNSQISTLKKKASLVTSGFDNSRWFCTPLNERVPSVQVYGAGHVGQAVVRQLSLLSCRIAWLDHREDWLELQTDLQVNRVLTDSPEDEIAKSPFNTCHIVMTHSHNVDFDICHAILKQGDFGYLGLIGSATKRRTFTKRLKQRGHNDDLIGRMNCPIGNLQLKSSVPSVIALNLAAELTSLWEQAVTPEC